MYWNHCTITGELLEEPVIIKLTGHIFKKRVSFGTCTINDYLRYNLNLSK